MLLPGKLEHLGLIGLRASPPGYLHESLHQLRRMQHELVGNTPSAEDLLGQWRMDTCRKVLAVKPPGGKAISLQERGFAGESARLLLGERQADHARLSRLTRNRFLLDDLVQKSLAFIGKGHHGVSGFIPQASDAVSI